MKNKDRLGGRIQMEDLSPKDQEEVRSLINFRKRYRKERKHGNEKGDRTSLEECEVLRAVAEYVQKTQKEIEVDL